MSLSSGKRSEEDRTFYEQANQKIYEWLLDEEKSLIRLEFRTRDQDFDSQDPEEKLLALLRFLEVRYVRLPLRVAKIDELWKGIRKSKDAEDIEFEVPNSLGEYIPVSEIHRKMRSSDELSKLFEQTLLAIGVKELYQKFVLGRK
ncbi:hypothetical protein E6H31_00450 [Candidatus Bathyarchaeota archaeon]|nr:MAG: hypothetical protein E6H31_00450 [Candidatus Bathyarchaeota archaeon]